MRSRPVPRGRRARSLSLLLAASLLASGLAACVPPFVGRSTGGADAKTPLMSVAELRARLAADSSAAGRDSTPTSEAAQRTTVSTRPVPAAAAARPGARRPARDTAAAAATTTAATATPARPPSGAKTAAVQPSGTKPSGTKPSSPITPRDTAPPTARTRSTPHPVDPPKRWITKTGKAASVSVSWMDTPLADVLMLFANVSGLSIVPSDEPAVLSKKISGDITDQPWHIAFETLLKAHNLRALQDTTTGIITVMTESRSAANRDPEIIRLRYVNATDIVPTLQTIIGAGGEGASDVINTINTGGNNSNTLLIYTSEEKMRKVREMVAKIDRKRPTVTIRAQLVLLNRSNLEKLGFSYSIIPTPPTPPTTGTGSGTTPTQPGAMVTPFQNYPGMQPQQGSGSTFSLMHTLALGGVVNLNTFFDVMRSVGMAEVEASPLITTTSDKAASIDVGEFFILPNQGSVLQANGLPFYGQYPGAYPGGMPGGYPGSYPGSYPGYPQQPGYPMQPGTPLPGYPSTGYPQQPGYPMPGYPMPGYPSTGMPGGANGQGGWGGFSSGTKLSVTPFVLPNGRVRMELDISRSGATLAPDGQTLQGPQQSAKTEVTVHNGEAIVVGGLTIVERSSAITGVPVLQDLPFLGRLFKRTQDATLRQDLVIVVTPHVVFDQDDDLAPIPSEPSDARSAP